MTLEFCFAFVLHIPYTFRSGAFGDEEEKCFFLHYMGEGGVELSFISSGFFLSVCK